MFDFSISQKETDLAFTEGNKPFAKGQNIND